MKYLIPTALLLTACQHQPQDWEIRLTGANEGVICEVQTDDYEGQALFTYDEIAHVLQQHQAN